MLVLSLVSSIISWCVSSVFAQHMAPKAACTKGCAKAKHGLTKKKLANVPEETLKEKLDRFKASSKKTPDDAAKLIDSLDAKSSQLLWKSFELSRKSEACDKDFRDATSGAGSLQKKRALLKAWLVDGGSCRGQCYKEQFSSINVMHSDRYDASWQPLQYMITKHGKTELAGLVESGAIVVRQNPKDHRYYQFKEESTTETWATTHSKGVQGKTEIPVATQEFLTWARQDLKGISKDDLWQWDQGLKDVEAEARGDHCVCTCVFAAIQVKPICRTPRVLLERNASCILACILHLAVHLDV